MKLRIKDLGRIEAAEMEIRPLTVLVGKNNTNKTWTAYALEELRQRDATVSMQLDYAQRSLRMHWTAGEPEVALSVQFDSVGALRERAAKLLRAFAQRFLSMGVVLVLPAERKALVAAYKQSEDGGVREEVMSRPVGAYVNFLVTTDRLWRTRKGTAMPSALGFLDERILGGAIEFQGRESGHRLVFVPQGGRRCRCTRPRRSCARSRASICTFATGRGRGTR